MELRNRTGKECCSFRVQSHVRLYEARVSSGVDFVFFCSGSKKEAIDMLDLAVKKGVKSWIEVTPSTSHTSFLPL